MHQYKYQILTVVFVVMFGVYGHAQAQFDRCPGTEQPGEVTLHDIQLICSGALTNGRHVEQLNTEPPRSPSVTACNDGLPVPTNWVIINYSTDITNCGSGTNNQYTLSDLNGQPSAYSIVVCSTSTTIPQGFIINDNQHGAANCGTGSGVYRTLLKIDGEPSGAQERECQYGLSLPTGWAVVPNSTVSDQFHCGTVNEDTVRNNNPPPPPPPGPRNELLMQTDGNLVSYNKDGTAIWSSQTQGTGAGIVRVQDDGNLVLYAYVWSAGVYATPSPGPFPPQTCSIGTLLHAPQMMFGGQCIVSPKGQYMLYQDPSGVLFIYDIAHGVGTWGAEGTPNNPGAFLNFQPDYNLVDYDAGSNFLWQSGTYGTGADLLNMEDDGRIILYRPVWSSQTSRGWDTTARPHPSCDMGSGTGQTGALSPGQCFVSPNGRYELLLAPDNSVMLYDLSVNPPAVLWQRP